MDTCIDKILRSEVEVGGGCQDVDAGCRRSMKKSFCSLIICSQKARENR